MPLVGSHGPVSDYPHHEFKSDLLGPHGSGLGSHKVIAGAGVGKRWFDIQPDMETRRDDISTDDTHNSANLNIQASDFQSHCTLFHQRRSSFVQSIIVSRSQHIHKPRVIYHLSPRSC
jgi:hypothetical protein